MSKLNCGLTGRQLAGRSFSLVLVSNFVFCTPSWADDLFGGGADPFGGRLTDPIGGPDIDDEQRERQRQAAEAEKKILLARGLHRRAAELAKSMVRQSDDAWCLEGALALLNDGWFHYGVESFDEFLGLLEHLAGHSWRAMPEETPEGMLARIQREFEVDQDESAKEYRLCAAEFKELSDEPWTFDWQANKELWLTVAATMVRSHDAEDPSDLWRARMKDDPKNQRLYRYCYVALARQQKLSKLDFDLIKPMLERHRTDSVIDLGWQARVLRTYVAARVPVDHPERVAVRELFLTNLKSLRLDRDLRAGNFTYNYYHLRAIGRLYDVSVERLERQPILNAFVESGPKGVQYLGRVAAVSDADLRELLLSRTTTVECDDIPLRDVIEFLESQTTLTLVIDEAVRADATPVSLAMTGTWLDVTESLLAKTKYQFEPLDREMFWIGKPEGAERLREMLARGPERSVFGSEKVVAALQHPTQLEFIDTPLRDVTDFLEDYHGMGIQPLGDIAAEILTIRGYGISLHLGLELLCAELEAGWNAIDDLIVIVSDEDLKKLEALQTDRLRRQARLRRADGKVAGQLRQLANFQFIETRLEDVVDYLSDLYDVPVRLIDRKIGDIPVTMNLRAVSFDLALDLMTFQLDLAWFTDGQEISIGNQKAVKELREMRLID